jgi:predicted acetyltransferase
VAIELEKITEDGLIALKNLFELGAYDLSELSGANINENGMYLADNKFFKEWHEDPNYYLFFIRVDGSLAGFVVIKHIVEEDIYYLNHFFILRKFRKQNIGKQAAILAFDLFAGNWRVSEFDWNTPAQIFWRKVLTHYTNDKFTDTRRKDNKGPAQEFTNRI